MPLVLNGWVASNKCFCFCFLPPNFQQFFTNEVSKSKKSISGAISLGPNRKSHYLLALWQEASVIFFSQYYATDIYLICHLASPMGLLQPLLLSRCCPPHEKFSFQLFFPRCLYLKFFQVECHSLFHIANVLYNFFGFPGVCRISSFGVICKFH